jgi:ADP-ribosylation factor protein 1
MSSIIASMLNALYPRTEIRALMLSLDAAGKTSILYKLKLGEIGNILLRMYYILILIIF